jgi:predicted nucleic acid-binding protein
MAREVTLDANVIVAQLDGADVLAQRAQAHGRRLRGEGADLVLLDVLVGEAVSVLCRRARERRSGEPDLLAALTIVRGWAHAGSIRWVAGQAERVVGPVLDVVQETGGRLNFNDGLLVVLQREGLVDEVASFDRDFDLVQDFRRIE